MFEVTTAVKKIAALRKRIRVIQGGTSAGKTIAIMMLLVDLAQSHPWHDTSISVVTDSVPNLKKGAMRDFLNIMQSHHYFDRDKWNKTDSIYDFDDGAYIEFFALDNPQKARGPRRRVLYINEANRIAYPIYEQLEIRTSDIIILDYNPVAEFWAHTEINANVEVDNDFIILTYKDNEALSPRIVQSIESRQKNENWWRIYGMGEVGINEGQVYTHFERISEIPEDAQLVRRGLDFGFTNDPAGLLDVYKWNGGFIWDEQLYATGQSNRALANKLRELEGLEPVDQGGNYSGGTRILTVADSSEPKSIDEMKGYGIKIIGAVKGPDSVNYGIQKLQEVPIYVTDRSTNIWKEYYNYLWKIDKLTEKPLNVPVDDFNHLMDAGRYATVDAMGRMPTMLQHLKSEAAKLQGLPEEAEENQAW